MSGYRPGALLVESAWSNGGMENNVELGNRVPILKEVSFEDESDVLVLSRVPNPSRQIVKPCFLW
jgi:hypothetical protein